MKRWFSRKPQPDQREADVLAAMEAAETSHATNLEKNKERFRSLVSYVNRIPGVTAGSGADDRSGWTFGLTIDIDHPHAWSVVQELASVINGLSLGDRLPTTFMPLSPPPALNGGPADYLTWIVQCHDPRFEPEMLKGWLEGRLPRPVDDLAQWTRDDDEL